MDEQSKKEIKDLLLSYDRTLLVADPRRCEPKKCVAQTPIVQLHIYFEDPIRLLTAAQRCALQQWRLFLLTMHPKHRST